MSLRIRRGTNAERLGITFELGEIVWTTDTQKLYVGDNTTAGGINIFSNSMGAGLLFNSATQTINLDLGSASTDNLPEGVNNLYFTDPRASSAVATALINGAPPGTGVTYTYDETENAIYTLFDFGTISNEAIYSTVGAMFINAIPDDVTFTLNESNEMTATLNSDKVKLYAQELLSHSGHTGISFTYDDTNNLLIAAVDTSNTESVVAGLFTSGSQTDITSTYSAGKIDLALSTQRVQDIVSELFTPGVTHTNIDFTYDNIAHTLTAVVTGFLTSVESDLSPSLGGNLALNQFDITGDGNININGIAKLSPRTAEPTMPSAGTFAVANGVEWDPFNMDLNYPVFWDGFSWNSLMGYQQTNIFFVDPYRANYTNATGSLHKPFATVTDAISAATGSGYGFGNPAFVVLLGNVIENITLTSNGIHISGILSSDSNNSPTILGTITIDGDDPGMGSSNYFSISNLKVIPNAGINAITFTGTFSQTLQLTNLKIEGQILINNVSTSSIVNIDNSKIAFNNVEFPAIDVISENTLNLRNVEILGTAKSLQISNNGSANIIYSTLNSSNVSIVNIDTGMLSASYTKFVNTSSDNDGIELLTSGSSATVTNSEFDISTTGLGAAVYGVSGTTFMHQHNVFAMNSNTVISSDIGAGIIDLDNMFVPTINPTVSILESTNSVNEGDIVTFTLTTSGFPDGTVLYWIIQGAISSSDFIGNLLSGSISINSNSGEISVTVTEDLLTEGSEPFIVNVKTGSIFGKTIATSATITINDTSTTPPTYSIVPDLTNVNEGVTVTFDVATTDVPNGTTLYWTTLPDTGTFTTSDFDDNALDGTVVINSSMGSITRTVALDALTESTESFSIELRTGSAVGPVVATSAIVTVNDTSLDPTYLIVPDVTTVAEGETVTFTVTTTDVPDNTTLYWTTNTVVGLFTIADFSDSEVDGTVVINSSTGTVTRTLAPDATSEGNESFQIELRTGSAVGPVVATSAIVAVTDA